MYGMLMESVKHFMKLEYGEETWQLILEESGLPKDTVFHPLEIYADDVMKKLARSASIVIGKNKRNGGTPEEFLHFYGTCFIRYATRIHQSYGKIIKSCGRFFTNFLMCTDNLHLQMKYSFPKMVSPSIHISQPDPDGVLLTYRTFRKDYIPFLSGILGTVAETYYGITDLTIQELPESRKESATDGYKYLLRLNFDNRAYLADQATVKGLVTPSIDESLSPVPGKIMMQLFPFTLVFRPDLNIIEIGDKLKEMYPAGTFIGQSLTSVIKMRRPKLSLTWENMVSLQKVMCEVELLPDHHITTPGRRIALLKSPSSDDDEVLIARHLFLQGRTRYVEDWDAIMFLCNPLVNNSEDLAETGLAVSDLSLHGNSRDLVMKGWQHNARLENLYEEAEEASELLEKAHFIRGEYKKCGDVLLYSMLPQSVADRLQSGEPAVNTCQAFENLTILFVELADVDQVVSPARLTSREIPVWKAIDAVNNAVSYMNLIFSYFDGLLDGHSVYKVNTTVGNIYMVVGGAPQANATHARDIAKVALRFRKETESFVVSDNDKLDGTTLGPSHPIRLGIHSGPAVAGVIGRKVPHYTIFGDTVNTAARMQSSSLPGKIQISESTFNLLQGFKCEARGIICVKGKGNMKTWWLLD